MRLAVIFTSIASALALLIVFASPQGASTGAPGPTETPTPTSNRPAPLIMVDKRVNGVDGPINVTVGDTVTYEWSLTYSSQHSYGAATAVVNDDTHDALDTACNALAGQCHATAVVQLLTPGPITNTLTAYIYTLPPWTCCGGGMASDSVTVIVVTATPSPTPTDTHTPTPTYTPTPKNPNGDTDGDTVPNDVDDDDDGDGCTDVRELDTNAMQGGRRNPHNPWDFYDVNGDKVVNVPNDVLSVALAFGLSSGPTYLPAKDRSAPPAPGVDPTDPNNLEPWDTGPPDGAISVIVDLVSVAKQFGHSCMATATHSISGVVYESFSGVLRGATVTRQPSGEQTTTRLVDGSFSFPNVADGSYTLTVSPGCTPFGCYVPTNVNVAGSDVFVAIYPYPLPTPTPNP